MKLINTIAALSLGLIAHTSALDIPSSIFTQDELTEAKIKAEEKQKALVFLISNPKLEPS